MVQTPQNSEEQSILPDDLLAIPLGLALSGGGYRASVFHLGTLAYLDRINLLPQLTRLSTVSGGTFTGARYIVSLVEEESFRAFFQSFYDFLQDTNLIEAGLEDYCHKAVRTPAGERKLICSMANVYADTFLKQGKNDTYKLEHILEATNLKVKEVVFNTTEFRTGESFHFQKSASAGDFMGSDSVPIPTESTKEIRIADIVATSSCFPGGFEPFAFPADFVWPGNCIPEGIQKAIEKKVPSAQEKKPDKQIERVGDRPVKDNAIALMDGGIYDNQGISSLLLADQHENVEPLGLLIISDVDGDVDDLFPYPANGSASTQFFNHFLTINQADGLIRIFLATCVLTIIAIAYELWRELAQGTFVFSQHFFSTVMPLLLVILGTSGLLYGRKLIRDQILPLIPEVGDRAWKNLKQLTVDEFLYVMRLRLESLLALTSSVFMDRIKVLSFRQLEADERYKDRCIHNQINRLLKVNWDKKIAQENSEAIDDASAPYKAGQSFLQNGSYRLALITPRHVSEIYTEGRYLIVAAKIDSRYYVRIFDGNGKILFGEKNNAFLPNVQHPQPRDAEIVKALDAALESNSVANATKSNLMLMITSRLALEIQWPLKNIVEFATHMPTSLWFSPDENIKKSQLESLVIAGQATICFSLLEYIAAQYGPDVEKYPEKIQDLWSTLLTDWKVFNETPSQLLPLQQC